LEVNAGYPEYEAFMASILFGSFLIAFACGMFAVIALPRWRRPACAGILLAIPVTAGIVVAVVWMHEAPHLALWGVRYILFHAGVQSLGGLVGMTFGRSLGRLLVRVILPPGARPRAAVLWLADGRSFPRPEGAFHPQ
jgi:hypothetical protein